jgi:bifunctional non-homologous end joining protein LigD
MPERVVPMLAKLGDLPSDQQRYGFEIKWDGIRAISYYEPGRFRIESRNLNDITAQYPELRRLGRQLGSHDTVLDGEIVAFDDRGRPSFERLQQRMHLTRDAEIRRRAQEVPARYMLFDVLYLEGRSLMSRPYEERREALESMGLEGPAWQTPRYHRGQGAALLEASAGQGLEGVVAKRLDSPYTPGRRSSSWIKVKNKQRAMLVIGGWLPEKDRGERLGALLVGYYDEQHKLRYAGRVGTGWNAKERTRLERALKPLARDRPPFDGKRGPKGARYVEPRLMAEIEFTEWTNEGILRHPSYKGLVDWKPEDVVLENPAHQDSSPSAVGSRRPAEEAVLDSAETTASLAPGRKAGKNAVEVDVDGRTLKLSNLDKLMYPKAGFTKGDLIDYYVRIAPVLLPHLHDRPLTLKRYPDGVEGKHFYEKQCPSHRPDWVQTAAVWSRHNKKNIDFCLVNDLPTLAWTANLADIELHTSLSLAEAVDRPTMMVFDLDPGAPADIIACCRVGVWLRDLFAELKLESFAKTSGSKGLQVYVPLNGDDVTYDDTKPFARAVAELLEKQHPKQVVSRMTKSLRGGKVLIDWSQNDDHKTTICVYSLRAKEHPTVSTPVTWDEVEAASRRRSGNVLTFEHDHVLKRVERDGDLFAPVLALRQALPSL